MQRGTGRTMKSTNKLRCRFSGIAMLGLAAFAAGCQNGGGGAAPESAAAPAEPKVSQSELLAFCPPIGLRQGTSFFTSYEKPASPKRGAAADPDVPAAAAPDAPVQRVIYQTAITDVTRSCSRAGGTLTMKVGVAGKVVPGPAGKAGSVALPIRIAVLNGSDVVFSQLFRYEVAVADTSTATQFLFTAAEVSFPDPNVRSVRAYAGFDEGPPKDAATN